jgi:multiple sugar transport system permease protein
MTDTLQSRNAHVAKRSTDDTRTALLMAAPALLGLLLFVALPFLLAAILSFTNLRLGSPLPLQFLGLEQYRRVWLDPNFRQALLNNGLFALVMVPVQTALALGLALLLNRSLPGIAIFRTIFFMPVVFPMALVAVIWTIIYAPSANGMMNALLSSVTFGLWQPRDFLNDPALALDYDVVAVAGCGVSDGDYPIGVAVDSDRVI